MRALASIFRGKAVGARQANPVRGGRIMACPAPVPRCNGGCVSPKLHHGTHPMHKGFAFSAEAALSFLILLSASAFLLFFQHPEGKEGDFMLCADAAAVFVKSGAFESSEKLQAAVDGAGALSNRCISASAGGIAASSCGWGEARGERISLSIPAWSGELVEKAQVSCWRGETMQE